MRKNWLIKYTAYDIAGRVAKAGRMRVKNKETKFQAQVDFEGYLQRNVKGFARLVIHSCREETYLDQLLGKSNPLNSDNPFNFFK